MVHFVTPKRTIVVCRVHPEARYRNIIVIITVIINIIFVVIIVSNQHVLAKGVLHVGVPVLAKGVLHVGGACLSQGCVACGGCLS